MSWKLETCFAFMLFFVAPAALADVAAIHAEALPQETSVLAALDDARQIEPFCRSWTDNWNYPIAKSDVAARLEKDLGFLNMALKDHPDNVELLLLTGLVARYAYNLDVPGAFDMADHALNSAETLAPSDFRGPWFRATLQCQTTQTTPGAEGFLSIEQSHPSNQLPVAFWDNYMECATLTAMPAHVLRAADHLAHIVAPPSDIRTSLTDNARKRFDPFDPKKKYEPKELWAGSDSFADPAFTSTSCGIRLQAHGDWGIEQMGLGKGSCIVHFTTGPYKATTRKLHPSILVLVQPAGPNESLKDYLQKFLNEGTFEPFVPSRCPSSACLAMKGLQPGMYGKDGDGHPRVVVFERDQPEFPGLIFESPLVLPKPDISKGPQYLVLKQIQQRIPGRLFYLVLLDTAASIEDPAMKDFDFFLEHLIVE